MNTSDLEWVYLAATVRRCGTLNGAARAISIPRCPQGLLHAEHAADLVKTADVDTIFSSPLGRARTTAAILAARLALTVEVIDDLQEVHHGRIAGLSDTQIERDYPDVAAGRARDKYRYRYRR